jgi:signal transduction histidine kinase
LSDFCKSLDNNESNTQITFQFFGEEKRIDSKYEIGFYRIAQELINNALKYSRATDLMVQLIQETGRAHLTVQDNGKGFDMQMLKISKGAGIANIKSRVESLNGQFDIYSEPDKGTEASVEFKNLN